MKKYQYFTHIIYGDAIVYRYPANENTNGFYFVENGVGGWRNAYPRICHDNWIEIPIRRAKEKFPKAFK